MSRILVIDDDRSILHVARASFEDTDVAVETASTAKMGLDAVQTTRPDVVLLDIALPDVSGLELFQQIHDLDSKLPVIFVTASGSSETAIEAMKLGAHDYLLKPLDVMLLREVVHRALEARRLMNVPVALPDDTCTDDTIDILLGRSPAMLEVYKEIGRVAAQNVTVLIRGESGTGKEMVARALYKYSDRPTGPFLAVNCAAIPDALLESELFGHEKGSFTGAHGRRIGKFEQCCGGTILLDEIGDMSILLQSKLLRLLQEQRFERVGGNETIQTDVRIIAATNRDLDRMVEEGTFRPDLYYRLNGVSIFLPPLRQRREDIPLLVERFLRRFASELNKDVQGVSPDALQMLVDYSWPGNVRELQSVLKQALLRASGPVILPSFLPEEVQHGHQKRPAMAGGADDLPLSDLEPFVDERLALGSDNLYAEVMEMVERYTVTRVLRVTGGNQSKAAQILGITRGSLRNKIRSLGIMVDQVVHLEQPALVEAGESKVRG
jgi:two-component system nitrogen regulation response regulator GlnG